MLNKKLLTFTMLFCLCLLVQAASAATVKDVTRAEAESIMKAEKNVTVIDIRTEAEFTSGHLDDAINIDFLGPDFANQIKDLAKKQPETDAWVVYCRSGNRSRKALPLLTKELPGTIYHIEKGLTR